MNKKALSEILIKELGYSEYEGETTADDLLNMQPRFLAALEKWFNTREETEITIGAISTTKLVSVKNYTYPGALIALNWVATEPEIAVPFLTSDIKP